MADDGVGFDLTAGSAEGHHGLRNMTNRARMLDGHLDIESAPRRGTTITLVVPLSARPSIAAPKGRTLTEPCVGTL